MSKKSSRVHYVDGNLRKGLYMFWDDRVYVIDGCDLRELTIDLIEYDTGHQRRLDYFEVFQNRDPDKEPIFANNLAELFQKIREAQQKSEDVGIVSEKGISKKLIEKG